MSETKKTSLEKAILEAREIENAAINSAKKIVEESIISKIEETVKSALTDLEKNSLNEGVSIDVGGADVSFDVEDGITSIKVDADEEDLTITPTEDENEDDENEVENNEDENDEVENDEDENDEDENDEDMEGEEEQLFEINLFEEELPAAPEATEAAPAEEMPAEEMPAEEAGATGMTVEVPTASAIEDLSAKLDAILSKLEAPAESAEDINAEPAAATEAGEEAPSAEGEIEIVDDEAVVTENNLLEIDIVGEDDDNEFSFELDDSEENFEDDSEEDDDEINDILNTLNSEEDFEDEPLDEMRGASHSVQRAFGNREHRADDGHHSPIYVNENKAQEEAVVAELIKENESLRKSLKEYKESFKVLRKQINEVQTFNAKLAYVNKLFSKGGLTNDEKVQIAESFDEVNTVEEAKTLYNKIISESKTFSNSKTEQLKSKLKSPNPNVAPSTKSEALYESREISRMKQLAGIETLKS
jgi:hypothetical protein